MTQYLRYVFMLLMYMDTGNKAIDDFVYNSSTIMEILSVIGVVWLVAKNENIRTGKRPEDRFIFWQCAMVTTQNVLQLLLIPLSEAKGRWADFAFYGSITVAEMLYLFNVLQWLVFVDYCLYRSMDHIRRRYRHAALPVVGVLVLDIIHTLVAVKIIHIGEADIYLKMLMETGKIAIEISYILTAIYIERKHAKESREPQFLRLEAFIIPFLFGALFRYYDASMMGFGIILTYQAVKRRDAFLDPKTDFYNRDFLLYLARYRDRKKYPPMSAIGFYVPGHGDALSELLGEVKPEHCSVAAYEKDRFLLLNDELTPSAEKMAVSLVTEECKLLAPPFEPEAFIAKQGKEESAEAFINRLLNGEYAARRRAGEGR